MAERLEGPVGTGPAKKLHPSPATSWLSGFPCKPWREAARDKDHCQHHTSGHLHLAPRQGEMEDKKVEEREPAFLQISPLQLILSVAILPVPSRFMLPTKAHICPVRIVIFSGCKHYWGVSGFCGCHFWW